MTIRFTITAPAGTDDTKTGTAAGFDESLFTAYMQFNETMRKAGILVASEGLNPAARDARVAVPNGMQHLVDGPFAESKELVGGFYIINVKSLEEAIAWALRAPSGWGSDAVLEVRQLTGPGDIPPEILKLIQSAAPTWSAAVRKTRA